MSISITRDEYLEFRKQPEEEFNKNEILRAYYNHVVEGYPIDTAGFFEAKYLMAEDEEQQGVLVDMDESYPLILNAFDVYFGITFLVENEKRTEIDRVLKGIF